MIDSRIYTSEPMATRALAAEIRNDWGRFLKLLSDSIPALRRPLTELKGISCETHDRTDIWLAASTENAGSDDLPVTVAIEAKFDHLPSDAQLEKEGKHANYVVLLVLDEADAACVTRQNGVMLWRDVISCFDNPRITQDEIDSIPSTKSTARRYLVGLQTEIERFMPESDWQFSVGNGGSGFPGLSFNSDSIIKNRDDTPRQIRGHIAVKNRGLRDSLETHDYEVFLGVEVPFDEANFPNPKTGKCPGWIPALRMLDEQVLRKPANKDMVNFLGLTRHSGQSLPGKLKENKIPLLETYYPGHKYLGQGYTDGWALGVRSHKLKYAEIPKAASYMANLAAQWRACYMPPTG